MGEMAPFDMSVLDSQRRCSSCDLRDLYGNGPIILVGTATFLTSGCDKVEVTGWKLEFQGYMGSW
jgi:hypothetical protein